MRRSSGLLREVASLLVGEPARDCSSLVALPPGRIVHGDEGDDVRPALWVSDEPGTAELWTALRSLHARSGLWPLLLDSLSGDAGRPWDDGELWPASMSSPSAHDAQALLSNWWADYTEIDETDMLSPAERIAVTAPYEQRWPGLAPPMPHQLDPEVHADRCAAQILADKPWLRLGLVAATCSADALTVAGWQGAANYTNDTAELSAILQSWERRFGARVLGAGYAEVYLSVAAPPTSPQEAVHVAAEHFAFCPDNVWQGRATRLTDYAELLIDAPIWAFWWD